MREAKHALSMVHRYLNTWVVWLSKFWLLHWNGKVDQISQIYYGNYLILQDLECDDDLERELLCKFEVDADLL